ncbi:hypothetical protein HY988_01885 [Candidatus Micrarchaeota archaeon]|nr:hypothetical protein [Candidatus Micrarchaeota archaeon]
MTREEILKTGYADVKMQVAGMRQAHRLKVTLEKTKDGFIAYLTSEQRLPTPELVRIAEELQFPIRCRGMLVLPKGKSPADFVEKNVTMAAATEETVVEAEIED